MVLGLRIREINCRCWEQSTNCSKIIVNVFYSSQKSPSWIKIGVFPLHIFNECLILLSLIGFSNKNFSIKLFSWWSLMQCCWYYTKSQSTSQGFVKWVTMAKWYWHNHLSSPSLRSPGFDSHPGQNINEKDDH